MGKGRGSARRRSRLMWNPGISGKLLLCSWLCIYPLCAETAFSHEETTGAAGPARLFLYSGTSSARLPQSERDSERIRDIGESGAPIDHFMPGLSPVYLIQQGASSLADQLDKFEAENPSAPLKRAAKGKRNRQQRAGYDLDADVSSWEHARRSAAHQLRQGTA